MLRNPSRKVAFISSYLPRRCGIATFTSDLIKNTKAAAGRSFEPLVVAMQSDDNLLYADPVKFEVRRNVKNDYVSAADYLNFSHVDIVSCQHEFGLFGGDGGSYLNLMLRRLNAPVVTTFHTVLDEPAEHYYKGTRSVCELSHKVIVMNQRGVGMLRDIYGIDEKKIELIPHGIPDLPFVDSNYYKHKFQMEGRRTILTFGLLSKGKGIEMMLKALHEIIKLDPKVLYIILGATHPDVLKREGEAYRFSLKQIVKDLGLSANVIFHNRFVDTEELYNFLCAADIYVTPYVNREQLTSGTLAFAVGTGKAVVSTPYWAAEELLADGRGKLVDFKNHHQLANAIIELIRDESLFYSLRRKAYDYGRNMAWPVVGKRYWKMFSTRRLTARVSPNALPPREESASILEIPEPPLDHLIRLADDTGLFQHARFTLPDRDHGYCTDDNARAVVAMTKHYSQYADPQALRLLDTCLSFICYAQNKNGTVHNFMTYDRRWAKDEPAHEALGRTLWALGAVMGKPPLPRYLPVMKDCFDRSVAHVPSLSIRGKAYAIFGMAHYLEQFPGASDTKRTVVAAADNLVEHFNRSCSPDWEWFEDILTYDNAVLCHALYIAAMITSDTKYLDVARRSSAFLLDNTYNGTHFSFIGCDGWYKKGSNRAKFDQQPIEVASTVMMLRAAHDATGDTEFLRLQRKAFDWFLGENDLREPVYDFRTKGCADGLHRNGVSLNQGAESMVSFLLALLTIVESYTAGITSSTNEETLHSDPPAQTAQSPIRDIAPSRTRPMIAKERI
jgi:glycosyltransferase involved in cell wall biosynthesis